MKRHIFSRFFIDSHSKKSLKELAQYAAVFYFNMRTVHFKTCGKSFLELHEYAQELYEQGEEYYDDLVETAISFNEEVVPMFVTPGDWIPASAEGCRDAAGSVALMLASVRNLYDFMENLDKERYPSFVQSKIDGILEWLDKQNYKLSQMEKEI